MVGKVVVTHHVHIDMQGAQLCISIFHTFLDCGKQWDQAVDPVKLVCKMLAYRGLTAGM